MMMASDRFTSLAMWFQRGLSERYAAVRESAGRLGARLTPGDGAEFADGAERGHVDHGHGCSIAACGLGRR